VVGRPHGRRLPFSLMRPVAVAVIKEAKCPVAVVPPDYDG
jgi:nucleotide-binding universal stress UspA family protein